MDPMTDLQKALQALQREVDEVFGGGGPRRAWHLDRVKLRLGVEWAEDGSAGLVGWRPSSSPSAHVVELEWQRGDGPAGDGGSACAAESGLKPAPVPLPEQLDGVFGKPGFDSAARATVFREAVAEVGVEGVEEVLAAVVARARLTDGVRDRARHAVTRLLERGPSGIEGGCAALGAALATHGVAAVMAEVENRWQYGTGHDLGQVD